MENVHVITQESFKKRFIYNPNEDLLGKGGFAKVYKAYDTLGKRTVALKIFTREDNNRYNIVREMQQMQTVSEHENLIQYYEVLEVESGNTDIHGIPIKTQVGIIEYANHETLEELMKTDLPESLRKKILKDILKGLQHLHNYNIIHRDLKPRNILIQNANGILTAKITDFGIAKALEQTDTTHSTTGIMGTIEYMAPEQIAPEQFGENGKINTKADLWSFGVLVYHWVSGKPLYKSNTTGTGNIQIVTAILEGIPKDRFQTISSTYRRIIECCLVTKASNRNITTDELLNYLTDIDLLGNKKEITNKKNNFSKLIRHRKPIKWILGIILIALVTFSILFLFNIKRNNNINNDFYFGELNDDSVIRINKIKEIDGEAYQYWPKSEISDGLGLPYKGDNKKYGFVFNNGNLINPIYDSMGHYNEGLALIKINGLFGYVNTEGVIIIPPKYKKAKQFSYGLAAVGVNGKWGFINKKDSLVIPIIYQFKSDTKRKFIKEQELPNKEYLHIEINLYESDCFRNGLKAVLINDKMGYIDTLGKIKIEPKFFLAADFFQGYAPAITQPSYIRNDTGLVSYNKSTLIKVNTNERNEKSVIINSTGKELITSKYIFTNFIQGYALFESGLNNENEDSSHLMDISGKIVISSSSEYLSLYPSFYVDNSEIKTPILFFNGFEKEIPKLGLVQENGKIITQSGKFKSIFTFFSDSSLIVKTNQEKKTFINLQGNLIFQMTFEDVSPFYNGRALVKNADNNYYIINKVGKYLCKKSN